MDHFVLNQYLILIVGVLALATHRNLNLSSLFLVMLLPKALDFLLLSPFWSEHRSADFRNWQPFTLALHDMLMIIVIKHRSWIQVLLRRHSAYRKMWQEDAFCWIFTFAFIWNICMFVEYSLRWYVDRDITFFHGMNVEVKYLLLILEYVLLAALTKQSLAAVRSLRKRNLID